MTVRNFYVKGTADGRKSPIDGGPRARDGGMTLTLTQRDKGSIQTAFVIESLAASVDGVLTTRVRDGDGRLIAEHVTQR